MANDNEITGNRGEWGELYAFLRLACDGELYGANADLSRDPEMVLKVLRVARVVKGKTFSVLPNLAGQSVTLSYDKTITEKVPALKRRLSQLLNVILTEESSSGSFACPDMEAFLREIGVAVIKADSKKKRDLDVTVKDNHTGGAQTYGFSVKSEFKAKATLLNASQTTLFRFKVEGITEEDARRLNAYRGPTRYRERMRELLRLGAKITPAGMRSKTFFRNLLMLDDGLPDIVARLLLHWRQRESDAEGSLSLSISELCDSLAENNPRDYPDTSLYRHKICRLLHASALGMLPGSPWDDRDDATGGVIVVKENGELVAFYVYNRARFSEYLINNTKLDTPSERNGAQLLLEWENGKCYFDLGLQIRFR